MSTRSPMAATANDPLLRDADLPMRATREVMAAVAAAPKRRSGLPTAWSTVSRRQSTPKPSTRVRLHASRGGLQPISLTTLCSWLSLWTVCLHSAAASRASAEVGLRSLRPTPALWDDARTSGSGGKRRSGSSAQIVPAARRTRNRTALRGYATGLCWRRPFCPDARDAQVDDRRHATAPASSPAEALIGTRPGRCHSAGPRTKRRTLACVRVKQ
jgi:hypothetical protein